MFMQNVRKSMKIFFWFLAAVFILFVFFDFGTTLTQGGIEEKGYIAKVGKKYITLNEFNQLYQNAVGNLKRQNLGPYEQKQISDEIINRIIINKVISKFINERNIKIDEKLAGKLVLSIPPYEIVNDSTFYENGIFNQEKYIEIMKDPRFAPFFQNYKNIFLSEMPLRIMNTELLDFVRITNSEVVQKILEDEVKVKVEYLYFKPDFSRSISVSDDETEIYFNDNYNSYKNIKALLSYTFFPINIYEEDKNNIKEIAENIISQLNAGISFDTLMSVYSDTIFDSEKKEIKDFNVDEREILKTMKIKETRILQKEKGIYIYYLREIEKKKYRLEKIFLKFKPSYENVTLVKNKIDDFIKLYKEDSLKAKEEYNVQFKKFYYKRYDENPIKIEYVFLLNNLKEGEFFYQLGEDGYYLIKVDKNFKKGLKYEDIKEVVKEDFKKEKIIQEDLRHAIEIRSKMKDKIDEFKNDGIYGITDYISINSECEPFIKKGIVYGAIFNLTKGIISSPIVDKNGIFIIRVIDREEPEIEFLKSKFQEYYMDFYDLKRKMVIDEWYRTLIDNAKIQDYRNIFNL